MLFKSAWGLESSDKPYRSQVVMSLPLRFPRGLYGITPEWNDTPRLLDAIRAAHEGGMVILQWRRKHAPPKLHLQQRQAVQQLCAQLELPLIINDDWVVARDMHAAGAHLGQHDGELLSARAGLHTNQWLGSTCYNQPTLAEHALQIGVDYVAFGAVYPSLIKPNAPRATPEILQQGRNLCERYGTHTRAAVVAIGGINTDNAAPLIKVGVDSIAVISSLFETPDIYATARAFSGLFNL